MLDTEIPPKACQAAGDDIQPSRFVTLSSITHLGVLQLLQQAKLLLYLEVVGINQACILLQAGYNFLQDVLQWAVMPTFVMSLKMTLCHLQQLHLEKVGLTSLEAFFSGRSRSC